MQCPVRDYVDRLGDSIEDPKQDEEDTQNIKAVLMSFGFVFGLLAFFIMVAYGLIALFK